MHRAFAEQLNQLRPLLLSARMGALLIKLVTIETKVTTENSLNNLQSRAQNLTNGALVLIMR